MKLDSCGLNLIQEPLLAPFGFKGGYVNELWNIAVRMDAAEESALGLGIQSILWSDADIFKSHTPVGGNALMLAITEYASQLALHTEFETPTELFSEIYPKVLAYGKQITGRETMRATFALNAMVPVDMAVWRLWAKKKGFKTFDDMIPTGAKPYLTARHDRLAAIPLLTYGIDRAGVKAEAESGSFFLKIKIGSDPDKDGDREKMLLWDMQRLSEIHEAIGQMETPYTDCGKVAYYLDANGRYDSLDRIKRFLDHADKIGALDQILLLEEPFAEEMKIDVSSLPVRVAADESVHSDADVRERADLGYTAVALKPIAKTMSMTFAMIEAAGKRSIPCFCADLTVNPFMVDVNKNYAARLAALPGMKVGALESNGHQNYVNWETLVRNHPSYPASWIGSKNGSFTLDARFWQTSGGIFEEPNGY